MKQTFFLRFVLCFFLVLPLPVSAQESSDPSASDAEQPALSTPTRVFSTIPMARPGGGKWRIGYYEGGDYDEYSLTLRAIAEGLQKLGWLGLPPVPDGISGEALWKFLAEHTQSDTVEFVGDAYWKSGNFDMELRPEMMKSFMERLKNKHDLDLMIAMGTWAGQDMVHLGTPIPTVVASASDPLESGIIKSPEDSGQDNLHAQIYPGYYRNQVRLFHSIVPFGKLGIVYEDSSEGRSYAAVAAVESVAREQKFTVVACHAPFSDVEIPVATQKALDCYRKIAPQVDAVYVTNHRGITPASIRTIAAILRHAQTPSFSMQGADEVKAGLLMSLTRAEKSLLGLFHAEVIARIFNGAKPRELNQIWVDPAKVVLNLETIRQIGFDPPMDILLAADEVYETGDIMR
jgi:ABC-type uncharacterized transport system substrate-binding protein